MDLRGKYALAQQIIKYSDEPNIYPLKISNLAGDISEAENFDDLMCWAIPPTELPHVLDQVVRAVIKFKSESKMPSVPAGQKKAVAPSEEEDPVDTVDTRSGTQGKAPSRMYIKHEPWPNHGTLSIPLLEKEITYQRACINNKEELPTLKAIFPDKANEAVGILLRFHPSTRGRADNWEQDREWNEQPIKLLQKLIELLPKKGVTPDIVSELTSVRLEDSESDASVANRYMEALQSVMHNRGYTEKPLQSLPAAQCKLVMKGVRESYKNSGSDYLKKVGHELFTNFIDYEGYEKEPETLLELVEKTFRVCHAIAKAHKLANSSHSKASNRRPSQTDFNSDRRRERQEPSGYDGGRDSKKPCKVCGRDTCGGRCPYYNHPHANKDRSVAWKDSEWGPVYRDKLPDFSTEVLLATKMAEQGSDGKYFLSKLPEDKMPKRSDKRTKYSGKRKSGDGIFDNSQKKFKVSSIATTNLNNFTSGHSTFNPLISARKINTGGTDKDPLLGTGIIDSGAFGGAINNYVSKYMVNKLAKS